MKFVAVDQLPNTIFLQGRLVNNIGKARILTRKEKDGLTPGSPDVRIKLLNGDSKMISRNELLETCRDHTGKKIHMSRIKDGQEFRVTIPSKDLSTVVGIFKVPRKLGCNFYVNRQMADGSIKRIAVGSGDIVVYMFDTKNKTFDRRYPLVVKQDMFSKMFIIAEKDLAQANQRIINSTLQYLKDKSSGKIKDTVETKVDVKEVVAENNKVNVNDSKPLKQSTGQQILRASADAPYFAVGRIVKAGTFNDVIGYRISDGKRTADLEVSKVMLLCRQRKIKNMCLVRANTKTYLRGVGVRLDTLETTFK